MNDAARRAALPRHIGLNMLYLVPGAVGGSEIYARELTPALAALLPEHRFTVYCGREARDSLRGERWPENVRVRALPVACRVKPLRIAAELLLLPIVAALDGVGLLHSLGTTGVPCSRGRRVVTVHDLIYHHFPETFPGLARRGLELLVPLGARRSHRVLADSAFTKRDLVDTYKLDGTRIDVVHLGVGFSPPAGATAEHEVRERYGLGDRAVLLCVASALAHKNIPRLFEAFAEVVAGAAERPPVLVVTGHTGRELDDLLALRERLGCTGDIVLTGWIATEDLEGLYALARGFVYPTLREGFGLPVLEAMRRGTPVACANTSSLPEIAGDAALTFDPGDTAAIATAIERLLNDDALAARLARQGREQAAAFTWDRCARNTAAAYERACTMR